MPLILSTHKNALLNFSKKMGLTFHRISGKDLTTSDVYHTNVIMSLFKKIAVLCEDAIPANFEKKQIISSLKTLVDMK